MSWTDVKVNEAAHLLLAARTRRERLAHWPDALRFESQEDAEAVCEAMARGFEQPIGAWKIGAMNPSSPAKHGLVRPFCGQVPQQLIYESGANLSWIELMRPVVEAEIVLILGQDLPPRPSIYTADEVSSAVTAVAPAIEIPESRLIDTHALGAMGMVADQGYAGRLVLGAPYSAWRECDLAAEQVQLRINDREVSTGQGIRAMGHPVNALLWLANYRSARGDGLRRGQAVSTGSLTGIHYTGHRDCVVAEFRTLGRVQVNLI